MNLRKLFRILNVRIDLMLIEETFVNTVCPFLPCCDKQVGYDNECHKEMIDEYFETVVTIDLYDLWKMVGKPRVGCTNEEKLRVKICTRLVLKSSNVSLICVNLKECRKSKGKMIVKVSGRHGKYVRG